MVACNSLHGIGIVCQQTRASPPSILHRFYQEQNGAPATFEVDELNELLKGINVRKVHHKGVVLQIIGLVAGTNPRQETCYWNEDKPASVSHDIEKGRLRNTMFILFG